MQISVSESAAREILDAAPAALDAVQQSFVQKRPLTLDEWRKAMQIIVFAQVYLKGAMVEEAA